MNNSKSLLILCFIVLITACAKTTVTVKSNPDDARAIFEKSGITAITDEKITVESSFFKSGEKTAKEYIIFEKEGYRTQDILKELKKGEDHIISVELDKLDTFVDIKSTPTPAQLKFVGKNGKKIVEYRPHRKEIEHDKLENINQYTLPEGWPKQFTTPIHLESTQDEAQQVMHSVKLVMPDDTGYVPTGDYLKLVRDGLDLNLIRGSTNEINIVLKPVVTTLRVKSNPAGAVVEDISSGGFGNIGKTPVIKHFNWDDVVRWSEKHKNQRLESGGGRSISLDLKIAKPGYKVTYLKSLRIPVGEERSFNKNLKPIITTFSFTSDPEGVIVSVERNQNKKVCDERGNNCITQVVTFRDRLGTTPFSLNVGPNGPFKHEKKLIFYKTGYIDAKVLFSKERDSYHVEMESEKVN